MASSFTVEKPKDFSAAFGKMRAFAEQQGDAGIKLDGDESKGTLCAYGVEGDYVTGADSIEITIRKKPALIPQRMIENEIKKAFSRFS